MRMEKRDFISVIVPVYNSANYLPQCVESILAQTCPDFELLLIDDGSRDNSGEICESYAERDARVRVIHQENAGVSAARNRGLEEACGEYIMFVDSDDYIDPAFLERARQAIQASGAEICICGVVVETFKNGEIISRTVYAAKGKKQYQVKELLEDMDAFYPATYIYSPCHKLYRRKVIEDGGVRFDSRISFWEDFLFNQECLARVNAVQVVDETYYHYRKENVNSLSQRRSPEQYDMTAYVFDRMRALLETLHCSEERRRRFEYEYANMLLSVVLGCYAQQYQNVSAQERRRMLVKLSRNDYVRRVPPGKGGSPTYKVMLLFLKLRLPRLLDLLLLIRYRSGILAWE